MKIGDLVKFKDHTIESGPTGIILSLETLSSSPHPCQPQRDVALIEWGDSYTPRGNYPVFLLEVVSESR